MSDEEVERKQIVQQELPDGHSLETPKNFHQVTTEIR